MPSQPNILGGLGAFGGLGAMKQRQWALNRFEIENVPAVLPPPLSIS
jgi:hypothetical protein